jgi:hypothetical protein
VSQDSEPKEEQQPPKDKVVLFMDDDPMRALRLYDWLTPEEIAKTVWTKDVTETLTVLRDYPELLERVSLDHDMTGETYVDSRRNDCGMEVVRWLENIPTEKRYKFFHTKFVVHTHNEKAARQMVERMKAIGLHVTYEPFGI